MDVLTYFNQYDGGSVLLDRLPIELVIMYKEVKRLFCNFVRFYNRSQFSINDETKSHIQALHKLWKGASMNKDLNYFFMMNTHNFYLDHLDYDTWKDYHAYYMKWRVYLIAFLEYS